MAWIGRIAQARWQLALVSGAFATVLGCTTVPSPPGPHRPALSGRVVVEWSGEDEFIYRRQPGQPLRFVTSKGIVIEPRDIYTDGGTVPRVFWSVDGLSPWGLGPAYIIHDWLFLRHRCGTPEERAQFTFEDSVQILREVGDELVRAGLVQESGKFLPAISWAVSTSTARRYWDQPIGANCDEPPSVGAVARSLNRRPANVVDFTIPPPR